jgi:hypothetical protein
MPADVRQSWERIGTFLRTNAPKVWRVVRSPATEADLRAVEAAHGVTLPRDLANWWRGANGVVPGVINFFATIVPPGHGPPSTSSAIGRSKPTKTSPQT